jgi:serine/threonine-protein kinase
MRSAQPALASAATSARPNVVTTDVAPTTPPSLMPLAVTTNVESLPVAASSASPKIHAPVGARPSAKPSATSTTKPGCDPPYTIDAQGNRHFKAECYE